MASLRPGATIVVDFPGVTGTKRRPAVVLSSDVYHTTRPDMIIGLITSQTAGASTPSDHALKDWAQAGLRVPSAFRSFLVTLPQAAHQGIIGQLSDSDWHKVRACVKTALAKLDAPSTTPSEPES